MEESKNGFERYVAFGETIGWIAGGLTFFGFWIYSIEAYGFFIGVGLGWVPSLIIALIVLNLAFLLWGPVLILAIVFVAELIK